MSHFLNRWALGLCVGLIALLVASPPAAAQKPTEKELELAGDAYGRLVEADGQLDNLKKRAPRATVELKGDKEKYANVLTALQRLMQKAKTAQARTKEVEQKYALLKKGKTRYLDFRKLVAKARTAHVATLSAAKDFREAAKEAKIGPHVNSRAVDNYCSIYIMKMAAFEKAAESVNNQVP